jgi:hypothetical protein
MVIHESWAFIPCKGSGGHFLTNFFESIRELFQDGTTTKGCGGSFRNAQAVWGGETKRGSLPVLAGVVWIRVHSWLQINPRTCRCPPNYELTHIARVDACTWPLRMGIGVLAPNFPFRLGGGDCERCEVIWQGENSCHGRGLRRIQENWVTGGSVQAARRLATCDRSKVRKKQSFSWNSLQELCRHRRTERPVRRPCS